MSSRRFTKLVLGLALTSTVSTALADHLLECPTAEAVGRFSYGGALPYSYSAHTKIVQFVSVSIEKVRQIEQPRYGLVMYPVPVSLTDDPVTQNRLLLQQLVLETPTPVNYRIAPRTTIPMCIYTVPGKEQLTAFLFSNDQEDDDQAPTQERQITKFLQFTPFANKLS